MATDNYDIVGDLNAEAGDNVPAHGADAAHVNADPAPAAPRQVTSEEKTPALSLRDQISSALKGEEATPANSQQDGRARNPDGTFAPKAADAVADPNTQAPLAAPAVAAPTGIDPQVFASLPAETQGQLARTMEDVSQRQQRFAVLEPIEQLIGPRVDAWAMNGMAPAQALHQLLALSDFATRDPNGFIQYFAQNNGVDLEDLVLGMEPAEPVDPALQAVHSELAELRAWRDGQTQQQQQAAHSATVDHVVAFATEKGQDGQPLRPYFGELGDAVMPYVSMVKSQNPNWSHTQVLQEAYDRACWATPSVRNKLQQAAQVAADAERLRQQTERTQAARTASVSVPSRVPSSPPAAPNDPSRTLRDTIRQSIAAAS